MARLATRAGVEGGSLRVHTPLISLSKADIVRLGTKLGLDYGLTVSCYAPAADGTPCSRCDSCRLRAEGFAAAGITDPAHRANDRETK
jgi:7-cyano-7-deazaguanine synthase